MKFLLPIFLLLTLAAWLGLPAGAAEKPNILLIVSDDQGYEDTGFQGSPDIPTPQLDALARSGVRCTSGYVTHSFCSPTRAALLTGRYQQSFGHEYNPVYDPEDSQEGLPLSQKLLPQYLAESAYTTSWVGKWHLGAFPALTPQARGFSETFGFIGGGHRFIGWEPDAFQYTLPIQRMGRDVAEPRHLTTAFGEEAAAFVQRHKDAPWFLYLAFNAPHSPHEPTAERLEKFASIAHAPRRRYAAQISLMDDAIGTVTAALAASGQTQRTLIFFFSDNGGPLNKNGLQTVSNAPLRGGKGDLYEGGMRVPFLISWPGTLPAGTTYPEPVSSLDVLATSLAAAGSAPLPAKQTDGVDLLPYLKGTTKTAPHPRLCWRMAGGQKHAIREKNWKLVRAKNTPAELFDLTSDLSEKNDLAARHPDVVQRLTASLDAWEHELMPPVFPGSSVKNEDWGPGGANEASRKKKSAPPSRAPAPPAKP